MLERGAASGGEANSGDENEHEMGAGCGAAEEGSGEANGTKKKKTRRGSKGKARKIYVNSASQGDRSTLKKKRDAGSTGACQGGGNSPKV
jgi:hypothetical protein